MSAIWSFVEAPGIGLEAFDSIIQYIVVIDIINSVVMNALIPRVVTPLTLRSLYATSVRQVIKRLGPRTCYTTILPIKNLSVLVWRTET